MKEKIKAFIFRSSFLVKIYLFLGYIPTHISIKEILDSYGKIGRDTLCIQIGSNDGLVEDPINEHLKQKNWRGILVEPVPFLFKRLRANYAGYENKIAFENSAIAKEDGELMFYYLKESSNADLPFWYDKLGSFNKSVILKHKDSIPLFDSLLTEELINAISFNTLLAKHSVTKVDIIHIDTEGYDYEIIKLIDFEKINLDILIFEHKHLSMDDFKNASKLLRNQSFDMYVYQGDAIAISRKLRMKM